MSDKEGGVVLLPDNLIKNNSHAAIDKNSRLTSLDPKKVKAVAMNRCKRLELTKSEQNIRKRKTGHLEVFFAVKTP